MNSERINRATAVWANSLANTKCRNWFYNVRKTLAEVELYQYCTLDNAIPKQTIVSKVENVFMSKYKLEWLQSVSRTGSSSGRGRNKLRTYCTFKQQFLTENYCKIIMSRSHRAAFSKFRCGVAPIRLETGRYENLRVEDRKCTFCNTVEDESHVILECNLYDDLRQILFGRAQLIQPGFVNMSSQEQLKFIFTNTPIIRLAAKTCFSILQRRTSYLCK